MLNRHMVEWMDSSRHSLPLHQTDVNGQLHAPASLFSAKSALGGSVGILSLRTKFFPAGIQTPIPRPCTLYPSCLVRLS